MAYTFMPADRIGSSFAVVALFCVLTIFFFPAMQGPYSVVHGPVTALLAIRAATKIRLAMARLRIFRNSVGRARPWQWSASAISFFAEFPAGFLPVECASILRC